MTFDITKIANINDMAKYDKNHNAAHLPPYIDIIYEDSLKLSNFVTPLETE